MELEVAQWSQQILTDEAAVPFERRPGIGAVVDVGTTTLVAQQVDLASGDVIKVVTALNEQARHGADLMTRIEYERRHPGELRAIIHAQVRRMLADSGALEEIFLVGNTCMHHLFCGLSVDPLATTPFRSPHLGAHRLPPAVLGAPALFLPCAGGFVGSDLLAGLLATGLLDSSEPGALLDLGTNGEIAVGNRDGVVCASTAAGPAFEGGRVAQGMRAGHGAIDRVAVRDGHLQCHVIGGGAARGLCGSGLVDAVAGALELGWVAASGRVTTTPKEIELAGRGARDAIRRSRIAVGEGSRRSRAPGLVDRPLDQRRSSVSCRRVRQLHPRRERAAHRPAADLGDGPGGGRQHRAARRADAAARPVEPCRDAQ